MGLSFCFSVLQEQDVCVPAKNDKWVPHNLRTIMKVRNMPDPIPLRDLFWNYVPVTLHHVKIMQIYVETDQTALLFYSLIGWLVFFRLVYGRVDKPTSLF